MNYGKYFRLNQNVSRIEDGVAIFDYIDLPAYFESSSKNSMSPKYPISVTFTEDQVVFRVHYSAYKLRKADNYKYEYSIEKNHISPVYYNTKELKHMEEVLLAFPYNENSDNRLYHIVKDAYNTPYPLLLGNNSTFIYEIVKERYSPRKNENVSLREQLYNKLRESLDRDASYSTLWLMDIVKGAGGQFINLFDTTDESDNTKEPPPVKKFLRKLLLDFMFDLKHSDVFQSSKYYQSMYSGLMSNYYFSALMHKCEYYFYRELITKEIESVTENNKEDKEEKKNRLERLRLLYAQELFKAEESWIKDIINPFSEIYFEHNNIKDVKNDFDVWDSWFASPEEEMRRICFAKADACGKVHVCNAETLSEYLVLAKHGDETASKQMVYDRDKFRVAISQWFLKRYDFVDALRFHLFKYAECFFFSVAFLLIGLLFINPIAVTENFWSDIEVPILAASASVALLFCIVRIALKYKNEGGLFKDNLVGAKNKNVLRRQFALLLTVGLFVGALFYLPAYLHEYIWFENIVNGENEISANVMKLLLLLGQILIIWLGVNVIDKMCKVKLRWLSNMHIFYPRLIASIAAAWLSLAIGNELFGTFFDSVVSWGTSLWLTVIVFVFVMYEINKLLPWESTWNKAKRCLGLMLISYLISFLAGLCIVNFTGPRFLERSGKLDDFYSEYIENPNIRQTEKREYKFYRIGKVYEGMTDAERLNDLKNVHIVSTSFEKEAPQHPIVAKWDSIDLFILRDFLIQFAFVAMFMGIFIQMLFNDKTITET